MRGLVAERRVMVVKDILIDTGSSINIDALIAMIYRRPKRITLGVRMTSTESSSRVVSP